MTTFSGQLFLYGGFTSFEENRNPDLEAFGDTTVNNLKVEGKILNDFWRFDIDNREWYPVSQIDRIDWPPHLYKSASGNFHVS